MNDSVSVGATPGSSWSHAPGDRVIYIVARDVLSLHHRDSLSRGLSTALWRRRWLVLCFVLTFALGAIGYSYLATDWYVAQTVLTPASEKNMNGLASQLGSLSMLTSIAGINLDGQSNTAESLSVLKSRDFARKFIDDEGLLHVLLWTEWDPQKGRWKVADPRHQPDIRDAIRYFDRSVLLVNEDRKTGMVTLGIRWKDPVVAASWANAIVGRLNEQMRARALTQAEENVAYLRKELASTTEATVQVAIAQLIETELQKLMMARSNREFAFRVIDHAEVPKLRDWPKRRIVVALGILGGGACGFMAVFMLEFFAQKSSLARAET